VLYLHGGDFVGCSARTHRPLTCVDRAAGRAPVRADYRLAPEHPFPGAIEDVCAAWRALRVALAVAGPDRRMAEAAPAGLACLSSGAGQERAADDAVLQPSRGAGRSA
jgi:hypothetical protein